MENGGTGVLLGVHRIESARIAQKMTREAEFDDEGNHTFSGPVVRRMGDAYAVDCELTGSNSGTSSKPKCSLLELFRTTHIPQVETLVGPGGLYEGYIPVWQPDGGSAHVEGTREGVVVGGFMQYITDLMQRKGWLWEPQAAQMPYINACDLFLFPLMSRLHARMLREIGGMPSPDVIWEHVKKVFRDIPSADVAKAHLLAYRVAEKVIKEHGGNHFLDEGGCHVYTTPASGPTSSARTRASSARTGRRSRRRRKCGGRWCSIGLRWCSGSLGLGSSWCFWCSERCFWSVSVFTCGNGSCCGGSCRACWTASCSGGSLSIYGIHHRDASRAGNCGSPCSYHRI